MSLACWCFPGRTISCISWDNPRAQHECKLVRCLASLILQLTQHFVRWEGDVDWQEGIKYLVFGESLEMACKVNPLLCRVSWEIIVPVFITAYLSHSVLLACAHWGPITPPSCCVITDISPLPLTLQEQINGRQVCCIQHVNWGSAPQISFFSSPFYLVFNTKQPPLITSRLKTLSD